MAGLLKIIAIVLLLPALLRAEEEQNPKVFWSCRSTTTEKPVITDRPAPGDSRICIPLDLKRAAFQRIPAESFRFLGSGYGSQPPKEEQQRRQLRLQREPGLKPSTSFSARDTDQPDGSRRRKFEPKCEISGTARSSAPGEAKVRIRRGALTVDEIPLRLGGQGQPVKWKSLLAGACRNPEVTVVAEGPQE